MFILILKNFPFTPETVESNFNISIYNRYFNPYPANVENIVSS